MKEFDFTINGNKYSVEIKDFESNQATIEVNGTLYEVEVHKEIKQPKTPKLVRKEVPSPAGSDQIQKSSGQSFSVRAPLPGTILEIYVKQGDKIAVGQNLLNMEAMKMENNIKADKEGTIANIKVSTGDNVLQDDVLIEME